MFEDRRDEVSGDVGGRRVGDPVVDLVELPFGFGSEVDPARHEWAAHLASSRARTSSAGMARDGSALRASYAAAASARSHNSAVASNASSGSTDSRSRMARRLRASAGRDIPASYASASLIPASLRANDLAPRSPSADYTCFRASNAVTAIPWIGNDDFVLTPAEIRARLRAESGCTDERKMSSVSRALTGSGERTGMQRRPEVEFTYRLTGAGWSEARLTIGAASTPLSALPR